MRRTTAITRVDLSCYRHRPSSRLLLPLYQSISRGNGSIQFARLYRCVVASFGCRCFASICSRLIKRRCSLYKLVRESPEHFFSTTYEEVITVYFPMAMHRLRAARKQRWIQPLPENQRANIAFERALKSVSNPKLHDLPRLHLAYIIATDGNASPLTRSGAIEDPRRRSLKPAFVCA